MTWRQTFNRIIKHAGLALVVRLKLRRARTRGSPARRNTQNKVAVEILEFVVQAQLKIAGNGCG